MWEESVTACFQALAQHVPQKTGKTQKNLSLDSRFLGQILIRDLAEVKL
jgi:hypothetical protein